MEKGRGGLRDPRRRAADLGTIGMGGLKHASRV